MSDVRLSNASPTVERVDARQPDNNGQRPPVRRNLFGPPDREEIQRCFQASMRRDVEAFEERYNFDPVNERPLAPRNYVWQEDADAPEFYRRQPHRRQRRRAEVEEEVQQQQTQGGDRRASRKRRAADSGRCSSGRHGKRLHTDDDDDEGPSNGAGSQALTVSAAAAEEERPGRPEDRAELL